jgi:hypothetical protein
MRVMPDTRVSPSRLFFTLGNFSRSCSCVITVCFQTHNRQPAPQPAPAGCSGSSYLAMHVYPRKAGRESFAPPKVPGPAAARNKCPRRASREVLAQRALKKTTPPNHVLFLIILQKLVIPLLRLLPPSTMPGFQGLLPPYLRIPPRGESTLDQATGRRLSCRPCDQRRECKRDADG